MPASLSMDQYLDALAMASARLKEDATEAGWQTVVPTCPDWTTSQLVAHQGMVHRWASGIVSGTTIDTDAIEQQGLDASDPGAWLLAGADHLVTALQNAPADLDVPFFLADAPSSRTAWARRQAHETTVHWVDALAARLGSAPTADEIDIDAGFASDGVDELLMGFVPRARSKLRTSKPTILEVHATDTDDRWTLHLSSEQTPITTRERPADEPDTTWHGTAAQLYLAVWNRGSEVEQRGGNMLGLWQELVRIR